MFEATQSAGLPTGIEGFGVSAKDLTGDGDADLYVVGSNRLFIAKGDGTFREIDAKAAGLVRPQPNKSRPTADFDTGVSAGDVNRDGRPDIAVAHHYASAAEGNLPRKLSPDKIGPAPVRLTLDEKAFRFALNEDAMATDKLAEGIRRFDADARKLERLIISLGAATQAAA